MQGARWHIVRSQARLNHRFKQFGWLPGSTCRNGTKQACVPYSLHGSSESECNENKKHCGFLFFESRWKKLFVTFTLCRKHTLANEPFFSDSLSGRTSAALAESRLARLIMGASYSGSPPLVFIFKFHDKSNDRATHAPCGRRNLSWCWP